MTGPDVALCGWRVRSAVPLGLPDWRDPARPVDLTISLGLVPEHLTAPAGATPVVETGADGTCLIRLDGIARFLLRGGTDIVVEPAPQATEADLRCFLLGSVLAILCHQRGLIPLHAACVRIGTTAIALAGLSGAGKSALAAALALRGHEILADDLTVIDPDPQGPMILPIGRGVALYPDVRAALGFAGAWQPVRPGLDKHVLRPAGSPTIEAVSLGRIYLLDRAVPGSAESCAAIEQAEAARLLAIHCHARRIAGHLGAAVPLQAAWQRIAGPVPVSRLSRRFDLDHLPALAQAIEAGP